MSRVTILKFKAHFEFQTRAVLTEEVKMGGRIAVAVELEVNICESSEERGGEAVKMGANLSLLLRKVLRQLHYLYRATPRDFAV